MSRRATGNGSPIDRIVRYVGPIDRRGFLLTRSGPSSAPKYEALYVDGQTERIDPPEGLPRPTSDPAIRTKFQAVPSSLRGSTPAAKLASMFTGLIRYAVQCEFIRGNESNFSHTWERTHGLFEFPQPHRSGSDIARESVERSRRRYFIVEVSTNGVYAAPVTFGMTSHDAPTARAYLASPADVRARPDFEPHARTLNLHWFWTQKQQGQPGRVQRLMSEQQIAPAYRSGSPWYPACGWAFSISGTKAANVVAKFDNTAGFPCYFTSHLRLAIAAKLDGERTVSIVRFGKVARAFVVPHTFTEGGIVHVYGADQDEYNGAHVVTLATETYVEFAIEGTPASPATGPVRIAGGDAVLRLSAALTIAETGRVQFRRGGGGTLWYPIAPGLWRGVEPPFAPPQTMSGPVHVFYDGEEEILTRWGSVVANVAEFEMADPPGSIAGSNRWNGNAAGTHALGHPRVSVPIVQDPSCEYSYDVFIGSGSGERIGAHTVESHGFSGPSLPDEVTTYRNRFHGTAQSVPAGTTVAASSFANVYGLCGGGTGSGTILDETTITDVVMTAHSMTENASGTSSLILFGEEREAIASLVIQGQSASGATDINRSRYRSRRKQTLVDGPGPWTDIDVPEHAVSDILISRETISGVETRSATGQFTVRWSGGGGYAKFTALSGAGDVLSPRLVEFTRYVPGESETAQSDLLLMRGGLWHDEPQLVPKQQRTNAVYIFDGDVLTIGGFKPLDKRTPIGFIGPV